MSETASHSEQDHWAAVYSTKASDAVSWYQEEPALSLALIERAVRAPARVLDVGGGASYLADRLLERGYQPGVLDICDESLKLVRARLGTMAASVEWFVADVTKFASPHSWDVWHDRALFHFLTDPHDRMAYRAALMNATQSGSSVIIATFGPEGPERCSGLPTVRYSPKQLLQELGGDFELMETEWEDHHTPARGIQQFLYARFRRA